jgi:hypothetical protein
MIPFFTVLFLMILIAILPFQRYKKMCKVVNVEKRCPYKTEPKM